jgi:hypothetical protein
VIPKVADQWLEILIGVLDVLGQNSAILTQDFSSFPHPPSQMPAKYLKLCEISGSQGSECKDNKYSSDLGHSVVWSL